MTVLHNEEKCANKTVLFVLALTFLDAYYRTYLDKQLHGQFYALLFLNVAPSRRTSLVGVAGV